MARQKKSARLSSYKAKSGKTYYYLETTLSEKREIRKGKRQGKLVNKTKRTRLSAFDDYSTLERESKILEFEQFIEQHPKLNFDAIFASFTKNRLMAMLANTGYSIDELALLTNSTETELLDTSNWSENWSIYINDNGEKYKFEFRYNGSVFVKLF